MTAPSTASSSADVVTTPGGPRARFMICANGRSGTTFLTLALNNLPDVTSDFEFVWRPTFRTITNVHKVIPSRFTRVSVMLDNAFPGAETPVIGSKLVLNPRFYGALELCDLLITMDSDIRVIHLDRPAEDILASYLKSQGSTPADGGDAALASELLSSSKRDFAAGAGTGAKAAVNRNMTAKLFRQIQAVARFLPVFRKTHAAYMHLDYADIARRWDEICDFIGSRASPEERRRALEAVPIQKNPKLDLADIYADHEEIGRITHVLSAPGLPALAARLAAAYGPRAFLHILSYMAWRLREEINALRIRTRFRLLRQLP